MFRSVFSLFYRDPKSKPEVHLLETLCTTGEVFVLRENKCDVCERLEVLFMQKSCSFPLNVLNGKRMHLEKLIREKEEWIVSPVKRLEVLSGLFQQLGWFHDWFFPLPVWKPRAEQQAYSTSQTKSWAVSSKQVFCHTTWADFLYPAHCSAI